MTSDEHIQRSYDRIAAAYGAHLADELVHKPLDRALLGCFAELVGAGGLVYDLGCGPGHVGAFLAAAGLRVHGVDLSAAMVAQAQQRYGQLEFSQGDFRSMTLGDDTLDGVVAFYAIVHLRAEELDATFGEWWRIVRPHGRLLLAFHAGDATVHRDQMWDEPVDLDFRFLPTAAVSEALERAGFGIDAVTERAAYPDVEYASRRAYVLATRLPAAEDGRAATRAATPAATAPDDR